MGSKLRGSIHHGLGLVLAIVFVLPFFWAIMASLRPVGIPPAPSIEWWPQAPAWDNYPYLFQLLPMARYTLNSLIVVIISVPLTLVTASLAGFGMAQLPDMLRRRLVLLSIVLLMIPGASVWLFRFQIYRWLGLLDSLWALIVPALAGSNPLFVLLFYWNFRRIPTEIYEAAQLDGATVLTIWWRLVLPLAHPTTIGVIVLAFVMYWSDFISPVLYLFRTEAYTLPVGLQILRQLDPTNWPLLMSAAVIMTLPIVFLFSFLQRFFLHNLSLTKLFDKN